MSTVNILKNIDLAREIGKTNNSVKIAAVVSGNQVDKESWQKRLEEINPHIFNSDKSSVVLSLQEKIGSKTKEGNFLGTLLAYKSIKKKALTLGIEYRKFVILLGMLFGRGERMSPITQAKGCRKPAIEVTPENFTIDGKVRAITAIEEALMYFAPVAKYLENGGFRGVVNKWGDETEIASIDLREEPDTDFSSYDIIKIVSTSEITAQRAKEKEWIANDDDGTLLEQVSRGKKEIVIETLEKNNIEADEKGRYFAGVSLGPVAVSYDFLDTALDVFEDLIVEAGVHFDFDPYFIMALAMDKNQLKEWDEKVKNDKDMEDLIFMIPDFFTRVQTLKEEFSGRFSRDLNVKVLDIGKNIYWADVGQHAAMREKYMALNKNDANGIIARKLSSLPDKRDANGNIIFNSEISDETIVKDSVIVNSCIKGKGEINSSVILDSEFNDVSINGAFAVRSLRLGHTKLAPKSGLFESCGDEDLSLEESFRHVSVLTDEGKLDLVCKEDTNLRDKKNTYNVPIYGNKISFEEVFNKMFGVSMEELKKRRVKIWTKLKESNR